jgi:uncharacterized SAM-binding protein YcdF (DUF218 family)
MRRRAIAFLVAPLAALVPMSAALLAWALTSRWPWPLLAKTETLRSVAALMILGIGASYVYTWLAGMPAHVVLTRLGRTSLQVYVLTGLALTVTPIVGYFAYVVFYETRAGDVIAPIRRYAGDAAMLTAFFGSCGALVAGAYWALNVKPRR